MTILQQPSLGLFPLFLNTLVTHPKWSTTRQTLQNASKIHVLLLSQAYNCFWRLDQPYTQIQNLGKETKLNLPFLFWTRNTWTNLVASCRYLKSLGSQKLLAFHQVDCPGELNPRLWGNKPMAFHSINPSLTSKQNFNFGTMNRRQISSTALNWNIPKTTQ